VFEINDIGFLDMPKGRGVHAHKDSKTWDPQSPAMRPVQFAYVESRAGIECPRFRGKIGRRRNTISHVEAGHDILASAVASLEKVLADQGVVFFEGDRVYGTGVGLKKTQSSKR
jgi:hypothetical protein